MSDPDNDKKKPEDQTEVIQDAVIIEEDDQPEETDEGAVILDEPVETAEDAEQDVIEASEEATGDAPQDTPEEFQDEPAPTPETDEPTVIRQGGFVPMVLGGAVAAVLGFGASQVLFPNGLNGSDQAQAVADLTATVQQQAVQVSRLSKDLEAVKAAPADTSATGDLAGLVDDANASVAQLSDKLAGFETRLSDLEKRPAEGGASAAAVAAYEREVEALREAMEKQKTEIEALIQDAEAEKASAELTARQALIRTAISRIQVALDTGNGFTDPVADLQVSGVTVPAILLETAETGVPTLADLSASFPEAARNALSAARKEEGTGGKAWNFLRNQLGVRSLEPKEGADADAVLSRAEAALNDGRLSDAMAELQTLPELARVELTDWMTQATHRAQAIAAAETLSAAVASN
ncbi:COG4223 family protein [Thalassovita sp.]|uniref:COG4223 family protein n=1 Tax=Thalassovita sp. TaxID=1979401 RepID=UPI003B595869